MRRSFGGTGLNLEFLRFLAQPVFVIPWYAAGAIAVVWVLYDTFTANRHVTPALKAAWPIIALFFSEIGLALYVLSCRPKHIGSIKKQAGENQAKRAHHEFTIDTWKKVVGSDIHCVGGDGLGIMSAMVVTRLLGFSFWPEFPMNWWLVKIGWKHGMA